MLPVAQSGNIVLPADANTDIPAIALNWLSQYDIFREEVANHGFLWSSKMHGLIFPFYAVDYALNAKKLVAWQARLFPLGAANRPKYMTVGPKEEIYFLVNREKARSHGIILVEDVVSAIKVGRYACTMPLLGSNVSQRRMIQLQKFTKDLIFWLDYDKTVEANRFSQACSMIGYNTKVIMTQDDPKAVDDDEIQEILLEIGY